MREGPGREGPGEQPPRWLPVGSLGLSVAGLAISAYLSAEHFTSSSLLACPDTGAVNCLKVISSTYSRVLGIPVAVSGLAYFAVLAVWCSPPAWRAQRPLVRRGRLAAAALGVLSVIYLVWAELFGVGAVCLWCSAVHVITIALFTVIAGGTALTMPTVNT